MRSESRRDSRLFREVVRSLLKDGISLRFQADGRSMHPAIGNAETIEVEPVAAVVPGDVVMAETADGIRVHRVVNTGNALATRGDCCLDVDCDVRPLGVVSVVHDNEVRPVSRRSLGSVVRRWLARWRGRF